VKRALVAPLPWLALAAGAYACNAAPKNTCTPYSHAVSASGTPPSSCDGVCESAMLLPPDAGPDATAVTYEFCTVNCTQGGNATCSEGTTCVPVLEAGSYCIPTCGADAAPCPTPFTCGDAGYCQ